MYCKKAAHYLMQMFGVWTEQIFPKYFRQSMNIRHIYDKCQEFQGYQLAKIYLCVLKSDLFCGKYHPLRKLTECANTDQGLLLNHHAWTSL